MQVWEVDCRKKARTASLAVEVVGGRTAAFFRLQDVSFYIPYKVYRTTVTVYK